MLTNKPINIVPTEIFSHCLIYLKILFAYPQVVCPRVYIEELTSYFYFMTLKFIMICREQTYLFMPFWFVWFIESSKTNFKFGSPIKTLGSSII